MLDPGESSDATLMAMKRQIEQARAVHGGSGYRGAATERSIEWALGAWLRAVDAEDAYLIAHDGHRDPSLAPGTKATFEAAMAALEGG